MNHVTMAGAIALVAMCFTFPACSTVCNKNVRSMESARMHGPPPHAPAHGYRHKHGGVVLKYDSSLKVYAVAGRSNYYFYNGHYFRAMNDGWEITTQLDGPWKSVSIVELPKGLRKSAQAKNGKKRK